MRKIKNLLNLLDSDIALSVSGLKKEELEKINELRLRKGQPLCAVIKGKNYYIGNSPFLMKSAERAHICTDSEVEQSFLGITRHSVYAYEEQISSGYVSLPDGNRAGISGSFSYGDGQYRLSSVYGICIRIAREHFGCAEKIMPYVNDNGIKSTLVVSPPGGGKTSVLREIARNLSLCGKRVSVVDERGEIAGLHNGRPAMELGLSCDIISGCSKEDGIIMACRSLCPDVIVFDEIGSVKEALAVRNALNCGVSVIMSAHAGSIEEAFSRRQIKPLREANIIETAVLLGNAENPGQIKRIISVKEEKYEDLYNNTPVFCADGCGLF